MKYMTFVENDVEKLGVLAKNGQICPLDDLGYSYGSMLELIAAYDEDALQAGIVEKLAAYEGGIPLEQVKLAAPIPHPRHDILCIGQNYLEHALESARFKGIEYKKAACPVYFSKRVNRAVAPGEAILSHSDITSQLDYEAELAVIIGKRCDHVKPGEVFDHIFGYTIVNDVSARELQNGHVQYTFGKGLDGFAPMGPWIVTADEIPAPPALRVRTRVNGEPRQDASTSEFIFDIPYLISELSGGIVLEPGDILITGTPSGVGMGFQPPKYLKPGDTVECEIEGIGVLSNPVK